VIKRILPLLFIIASSSLAFAIEEKPMLPPRLNVIIDPGHGGNDQGTAVKLSSRLIKESDLTLKLSQKILKIIQEKYPQQIAASVTRFQNRYIPLQKRIDISKTERVDFYLSLHYNSAFSTSLSGTEIYFPEDSKSSSRADTILDAIKQDLVETGRIKQSLSFTHMLVPHWKTAQVKIRRAPFYVLENAAAPALLIEVGYLTNPSEQKALLKEENQDSAAESIVQALLDFKETRDKQLN
jgi:N-acetylmuramoyl-L-alanine amidase